MRTVFAHGRATDVVAGVAVGGMVEEPHRPRVADPFGVRCTLRKQRSRFNSGQGDIGSGEVQFMLFVAAGLSVVFFSGPMGEVEKTYSHEEE